MGSGATTGLINLLLLQGLWCWLLLPLLLLMVLQQAYVYTLLAIWYGPRAVVLAAFAATQ